MGINTLERGETEREARTESFAVERPVRVWLVDDKEVIRSLLRGALESYGWLECEREFGSAEDVLEALGRQRSPDLILLDNHMGGMSGVEAIRPIKLLAPGVRVVMLTTFSDRIDEADARRAGASDFLLKSYEMGELVDRIHQAMRRPVPPCEEVLVEPQSLVPEKSFEDRGFGLMKGLAALWGSRTRAATPS